MSKQTNKWALAGVALAEALASDEYNMETGFMCDVIDRIYGGGSDEHAGYAKNKAYTELWDSLRGGRFFGCFGLLELLRNDKVIPIPQHEETHAKRKLRIEVGLAFWTAVANHINTGNRNIRSIRTVGYDAVRELKL